MIHKWFSRREAYPATALSQLKIVQPILVGRDVGAVPPKPTIAESVLAPLQPRRKSHLAAPRRRQQRGENPSAPFFAGSGLLSGAVTPRKTRATTQFAQTFLSRSQCSDHVALTTFLTSCSTQRFIFVIFAEMQKINRENYSVWGRRKMISLCVFNNITY